VQTFLVVKILNNIFQPTYSQGRRQKNFQGGGPTKKRPKNSSIKGALNPNFLNLTINREKFCL